MNEAGRIADVFARHCEQEHKRGELSPSLASFAIFIEESIRALPKLTGFPAHHAAIRQHVEEFAEMRAIEQARRLSAA